MRNLAMAVVVAFFFAGTALSGEENLMAMRGAPPDGAVQVNSFTAKQTAQLHPATTRSGYFDWKDNCSRTSILLADNTVEWSGTIGFGMTPRFTAKRDEPGQASFLGLLIKELATNSSP